jgi:hypothetical protein
VLVGFIVMLARTCGHGQLMIFDTEGPLRAAGGRQPMIVAIQHCWLRRRRACKRKHQAFYFLGGYPERDVRESTDSKLDVEAK